jgi:aminoglycoside phosphotransferase (APT) family kinase protein
MVASLAPTATLKTLSASVNQVFRLIEESGETSIVKVYSSPARERRERHALEALAGVQGVPQIIERGSNDSMPWIKMTDGGVWNVASLPKNLTVVRSCGQVLRAIHDSTANITNLDSGIDSEYVATHFHSTLDRLERYRRRLGMPADVLEKAKRSSNTPVASGPVPSHTRPHPRNFLVNDRGVVSMIEWEYATLAPPEWDLSLATWRFSREIGEDAATALWQGYGASFPADRLLPWIAYHSSMMMLEAAERRDGRLGDLSYLVDDLARAVG